MAERTATQNINVKLKGAKEAEAQFKSLGGQIKSTIQSYAGTAAIVGVVSAAAIKFGKDAWEAGLKAEGVTRAFKRLDDPALLDNLRKATRGTVNDLDLMTRAVQAKNLGLPIQELATYFEFAQKRARETGESVEYLTDSIVMGIGRKSPLILDNLGLSAAKISERFKEMGDFGRAVGSVIKEELGGMGKSSEMAADQVDQLKVAYDNLALAVGKVIVSGQKSSSIMDALVLPLKLATEYVNSAISSGEKLARMFGIYIPPAKEVAKQTEEQSRQYERVTRTMNISQQMYTAWVDKKKEDLATTQQLLEYELRYWMATEGRKIEMAPMPEGIKPILFERQLGEIEEINTETFGNMQEPVESYATFVQNAAQNISNMWGQALLNQWDQGQSFFENMKRGFEQMLAAMAAQLAARAAIFGIFSMFGGGSLLGGGDFLKFLGFQHGGQFTVGGRGGPDSQLVAFRASPGEKVIVQPQHNITNNFHGYSSREIQKVIIPQIKRSARLGLA